MGEGTPKRWLNQIIPGSGISVTQREYDEWHSTGKVRGTRERIAEIKAEHRAYKIRMAAEARAGIDDYGDYEPRPRKSDWGWFGTGIRLW